MYIVRKCLFLGPLICAMEKEVNGRLDTVTTTTQRVYRILIIEFKFVLFLVHKTNCVRSLIRWGLCNLTKLLCLGLIKFNIYFSKVSKAT